MTTTFTELVAAWAEGRATTFRLDAEELRAAAADSKMDATFAMARRRFAESLDKCAAIMDACAADLRDTTPIECVLCGTASPQNEPCTGCGATA